MISRILLIAIAFATLGFSQVNAQINTYNPSEKEFELFKKQTTRFILLEGIALEDYKKILDEVWTVSPFTVEIGSTETLKKSSLSEGDAVVIHDKPDVISAGNIAHSSGSYHEIGFKYYTKVKGTKTVSSKIANILLTPGLSRRLDIDSDLIKDKYDTYSLGYLKNYFQQINHYLENNIEITVFENLKSDELSQLRKKTLFIDENFLYEFKTTNNLDPNKVFEDYSYDWKVIPSEELQNKILSADENMYYLIYSQLNALKLISIVNGKTGKTIYQQKRLISFDLKDKDIKKLNKAISKAK